MVNFSSQNDIVSYKKEQALGESHNIVGLFRQSGLSPQDALLQANSLIRQRYHEWYRSLAYLPSFGEKVDRDIQKYIEGVQNVVLANIHWR
ncbi:hypothetical protein N7495_004776 [Penicillium taxi]|uniref:uncharacterized protein n=1 Tax=Penicillium taxi TaxID=168475 RepID=UPI0025450963|nr:uncharacterized protein N7495_004776 [Penicillium taxi]KAJ5900032.1 hypothetical protein N7495_004776 [Penicillium taxi]